MVRCTKPPEWWTARLAVSVLPLLLFFITAGSVEASPVILTHIPCFFQRCFCEMPRPNVEVAEPANSWSAVCYCIVASGILYDAFPRWCTRARSQWTMYNRWELQLLFAFGVFMLGLGSFLFHGLYTEPSEFADFLGLALTGSFVFTYALTRLVLLIAAKYSSSKNSMMQCVVELAQFPTLFFFCVFWVFVVFQSICELLKETVTAGWLSWYAFGTEMVVGEIIELVLELKYRGRPRRLPDRCRYIAIALAAGSITIALISWGLSLARVLCDPYSSFQLHAVWHAFTASALAGQYAFYLNDVDCDKELPPLTPPNTQKLNDVPGNELPPAQP